MQNSLDLAGVESSILFGNDFQVSLEGSPLLGRLIQVSCGAGQCTTSDCPWFLPGPLDFQGAPPASLFWERESLQVKPPHLLSSTSPFPHLVCKKLTHSLSPTNSGKTDCLHGSMSSHSTIRAANQPTTASLLTLSFDWVHWVCKKQELGRTMPSSLVLSMPVFQGRIKKQRVVDLQFSDSFPLIPLLISISALLDHQHGWRPTQN